VIVPPDGGPAVFLCVGFGFFWGGGGEAVTAEWLRRELRNHLSVRKRLGWGK